MGKRSLTNIAIGTLALTAAMIGCGEPFTATGATSSSGSSSTSTLSGGGQGGGGGTSSGGGNGGGSTPCTPGDLSTCGAGQYCQKSSLGCVPCGPLSGGVVFGAPKEIALTLPSGGSSPTFPRIGANGQLLFTYSSETQGLEIGHADADGLLQWKDGVAESSGINSPLNNEAALYLPSPLGSVLMGIVTSNVNKAKDVILFNSDGNGTQVYAVNPGAMVNSQLDLVSGNTINTQIAVAPKVTRFWFISNKNSVTAQLVTLTPTKTPVAVPLETQIDSTSCPLASAVAPWATLDGQWLLLAAPRPSKNGPNCAAAPQGAPLHLYYTALDPKTGQQSGAKAQEFFRDAAEEQGTPSLSPDQCVLYYSQKDQAQSATKLFAAVRE